MKRGGKGEGKGRGGRDGRGGRGVMGDRGSGFKPNVREDEECLPTLTLTSFCLPQFKMKSSEGPICLQSDCVYTMESLIQSKV